MSDLISRADAIEVACNEMDWLDDGCVEERKTMIKDALSALPSAEVEQVVRCKDCLQKHIGGSVTHYYWCDLWDREVDADNYCSWAERREE